MKPFGRKVFSSVLALGLLFGLTVFSACDDEMDSTTISITGQWDGSINAPLGTVSLTLNLTGSHSDLGGTGIVEGDSFELAGTATSSTFSINFLVSGQIAANISGSYNSSTMTGNWSCPTCNAGAESGTLNLTR